MAEQLHWLSKITINDINGESHEYPVMNLEGLPAFCDPIPSQNPDAHIVSVKHRHSDPFGDEWTTISSFFVTPEERQRLEELVADVPLMEPVERFVLPC